MDDILLTQEISPLVSLDTAIQALESSDARERVRARQIVQAYSERLERLVEQHTNDLDQAQALQHDLELAQQVQASLLPQEGPDMEGYQFAAQTLPARYVSGDLYDIVPRDGVACHLVLADIAGKGVPAALLAATVRTLFRAEAERHDSPAAILSNVNRLLGKDLARTEGFITALAAHLDARRGQLTYVSAGHTEALWWRSARRVCQRLPATGLPLGIESGSALEETSISLRPGDVLVFYSDGVTEAENGDGALYGIERLERLLADHALLPAQTLVHEIVAAVDAFRGDAPRADDLTLIVLKVLPRTVSLTTPATLDHLDEIASLVRQVAMAYGAEFAYQIELAVCEIVTNVMRHACSLKGEVRAHVTVRPDEMQVDLYDDGDACDLDALPEPVLGELREGGYGLHIARSLVDELTYTTEKATADEAKGNHWQLIKRAG